MRPIFVLMKKRRSNCILLLCNCAVCCCSSGGGSGQRRSKEIVVNPKPGAIKAAEIMANPKIEFRDETSGVGVASEGNAAENDIPLFLERKLPKRVDFYRCALSSEKGETRCPEYSTFFLSRDGGSGVLDVVENLFANLKFGKI
ncbi:hypothetical protein AVEN_77323-1 [Araneus ventricosus]|uniref:Uncharacterized protein n=1 Tax=Araneus ventricosus TaxID=182803 RepID=A0A4Y2NAV2_ARAVE|nr:hypothetical protein AVEN_77323-1 [Araneus ventricosus]